MAKTENPPYRLRVKTGQESMAGRKAINEDSMGLLVPHEEELLRTKGVCAVIADGVSSAEAGREAAETCVQTFLGDYFSTPDTWTVATSAQKVLTALNRWLYAKSSSFLNVEKGYICTLSILVIKSCTAYLFHVGDTRIWVKRSGVLRQLTRDHSVTIAKDQQFLSRAMGLDSNVAVDFSKETLEPGDLFLLTSDGVHGVLSPERLSELLGDGDAADFDELSRRVLSEAIAAGSHDNVTCQLLRIDEVPHSSVDEYLDRLTALPFPPPLEVGMIVDGLCVEEEVHASARSQVYRVRCIKTGRVYALKTPSVNFEDDPAYIDRFSLEHWLGLRFKNPHLLASVPHGMKRTFLYNLMEFVEGPTLGTWLMRRENKVVRPPEEVVPIIEQVVKGLYALHRNEIIHQDLKPDNVIITPSGVAKIIDYGSCYVSGIDEIAVPIAREVALGTRGYSAPEYTLGGAITPCADQFSLGVLAYEMLTGRLPYGNAIENAKTLKQFEALTYTPAYVYNPRVPVWMDGALRKAVSIQANHRYAELSEFLYDLDHPNTEYLKGLTKTNDLPASSWRTVSLVLLGAEAVTLWLLWQRW